LKNSKVVSFLSPFKVGQAGNLWTLPRTLHSVNSFSWRPHICKIIRSNDNNPNTWQQSFLLAYLH